MSPIEPEDLIDSSQVAQALGLTHRHSVSTYRRRYADFPRPAVTRGKGRTNLWLRSDIEAWRSPTLAPGGAPSPVDRKRESIIDAAAELMATRSMTDISVREIAARAAVPHTLIYRYIGNKQDLERAVIDRTINEVLAFTEPSPEAALGGLDRLIHTLLHRQDSLRVIINSMLTADGAARHSDRAPVIALFLASLRSDIDSRRAAGTPQPTPAFPALSPEVAVGAVAALVVGWAAFEPRIKVGTGLTETPTEDLAALATAILNLARP
jgi:AcrR family transcriptional regulator